VKRLPTGTKPRAEIGGDVRGREAFDRDHRWGELGLAIVSIVNALPYVRFSLVLTALFGLGAFVRTLYGWRLGGGEDEPQGATSVPRCEGGR
jgi:hypothetical protein